MGLDMYLYAKLYVQNWDHYPPERRSVVTVKFGDGEPEVFEDAVYVYRQVGYWRKANQIHNWFVDNCQDGVDDCRDAYVERKQLVQLRKVVSKVLDGVIMTEGLIHTGTVYDTDNPQGRKEFETGKVVANPEFVSRLLPAVEGFFFGSTEYNEWYVKDLEETEEILARALAMPEEYEFEYHSSW